MRVIDGKPPTVVEHSRKRPGQVFDDVVSKMAPGDRALFVQQMRVTWRRIGDFELLRALDDWEKMMQSSALTKCGSAGLVSSDSGLREPIIPGSKWRRWEG